jgi:hypothetical protein
MIDLELETPEGTRCLRAPLSYPPPEPIALPDRRWLLGPLVAGHYAPVAAGGMGSGLTVGARLGYRNEWLGPYQLWFDVGARGGICNDECPPPTHTLIVAPQISTTIDRYFWQSAVTPLSPLANHRFAAGVQLGYQLAFAAPERKDEGYDPDRVLHGPKAAIEIAWLPEPNFKGLVRPLFGVPWFRLEAPVELWFSSAGATRVGTTVGVALSYGWYL